MGTKEPQASSGNLLSRPNSILEKYSGIIYNLRLGCFSIWVDYCSNDTLLQTINKQIRTMTAIYWVLALCENTWLEQCWGCSVEFSCKCCFCLDFIYISIYGRQKWHLQTENFNLTSGLGSNYLVCQWENVRYGGGLCLITLKLIDYIKALCWFCITKITWLLR